MREITVKLYQFAELTDKAKEKARDWFRQGNDGSFEWDHIDEDAKEIGLEIIELDQHRVNRGKFITTALECAEKIVRNHGEACETHKTASAYIKDRNALELDDDGDFVDQDEADELTDEFLRSLLSDYWHMYEKEIEYQNSDECVDENITINEYEFTDDGNRA